MSEGSDNASDLRAATGAPLVSIIIPAYKVAPFIKDTLDSVFAQTFKDFEAIVINDGSPDTDDLERALKPYSDRIIYLSQKNGGAGAARNAGLRAARGRLVAFLDGDDTYGPTFLKEQLELIESNGGFDLVYADATNFGEITPDGLTNMDVNQSRGVVDAEALISGRCNVITSAVLARRDQILEVGSFDETLRNSQDFDLWIRLAKHGARFNYQRKVLVGRRIYEGSLASDPINSFEGELRVLQKTKLRDDLTPAERAAIEATLALRRAAIELIRGKRCLLEGDFNSASKSFQFANEYLRSWKLRLVLLWLRLAPGLLQRCYKLRPT
jgi:glycosyltransferase involved in cell wall biosynthesis